MRPAIRVQWNRERPPLARQQIHEGAEFVAALAVALLWFVAATALLVGWVS